MQAIATPETQIQKANQIFDGVFVQSLDFKIEMPYDAAVQFIRRIGTYNDFEPETVIETLGRVDSLIPRRFYNEGNPNNGERRYDISVGREGSPVVYLEYFEWRDSQRLDEGTMQAICGEMELHGMADEATYKIETSSNQARNVTFRFWWD
jgi:hypothetical protein